MDTKDFYNMFQSYLEEIKDLTNKKNKASVLIIQQRPNENDICPLLPMIRESLTNIIGFVDIANAELVDYIVSKSVGIIDYVVYDSLNKRADSEEIICSIQQTTRQYGIRCISFNDFDVWVSATINLIKRIVSTDIRKKKVVVLGRNFLATRIILNLINEGVEIYLVKQDYEQLSFPYDKTSEINISCSNIHFISPEKKYDVLLGCEMNDRYKYLSEISSCNFESIFDVGVKNFDEEFIDKMINLGCVNVYRSDDRAGIAGLLLNIMETEFLYNHTMGRKQVGDIWTVSGGIIGKNGDIVIDDINDPKSVLGVANGDGTFKQILSEDDNIKLNKIQSLI